MGLVHFFEQHGYNTCSVPSDQVTIESFRTTLNRICPTVNRKVFDLEQYSRLLQFGIDSQKTLFKDALN